MGTTLPPSNSGSASSGGPPPDELLKMLADRFERLEASIGHMETNLALGQVGGNVSSTSSDLIHKVGEDGQVTSLSMDQGMDSEGIDLCALRDDVSGCQTGVG